MSIERLWSYPGTRNRSLKHGHHEGNDHADLDGDGQLTPSQSGSRRQDSAAHAPGDWPRTRKSSSGSGHSGGARGDRQIVESVLSSLVACHECDLLHKKVEIEVGAVARCMRCNASLYTKKRNSIDRSLAVGLAALIMFVVANAFPFLQISVSGNTQSMSIISAVYALSGEGLWLLALVCFGFILLFPLFRMAGLLYILLPLRFQRRLPGMELVFRWIVYLSPWSMMEIYLFGAIVALVKLASMANIELGYSFWAFALLNVLTVASLQMIDNHSLWEFLSKSRGEVAG